MNKKQQILVKATHTQRGLSLVELLIAITLGLFLIWGVTQAFLSSKQTYRLQQGLARIQENGRLAQEFMGYDIRNAGDYGCGNGDNFIRGASDIRNDLPVQSPALPACNTSPYGTPGINMITATTSIDNDYVYAVYGFDGGDTAAPSSVDPATGTLTTNSGTTKVLPTPYPKANTDVLMVQTSASLGVLTSSEGGLLPAALTQVTTLPLSKSLATAVPAGTSVAVSDCATTKIYVVDAAAVNAASITPTASAGSNYCTYAGFLAGASVRQLTTVYYYIAQSSAGAGVYSLYKYDSVNGAQELLQGVDDMQLKFGVDTNGDGVVDVWRDPTNVSAAEWDGWDWNYTTSTKDPNLVRAVRYSLLLRSEDNVLSAEQTIVFNGTTLYGGATTAGSGDHRLRQVFTSTVGIRSRVIAP